MTRQSFKSVYQSQSWNRDSSLVLAGAMQGKTNNVTDITLATGTAVTTLTYPLIGPDSFVDLVPTNTYAATLTGVWVDAQTIGAAIIRHPAAVSIAATMRLCVVG